MSNTPRTDALVMPAGARPPMAETVTADFARTLERELARANAEMIQMEREFQREAREIAAEERWKIMQGDEYGSY